MHSFPCFFLESLEDGVGKQLKSPLLTQLDPQAIIHWVRNPRVPRPPPPAFTSSLSPVQGDSLFGNMKQTTGLSVSSSESATGRLAKISSQASLIKALSGPGLLCPDARPLLRAQGSSLLPSP